jgi:L-iditol 2-dehydrogenase
MCQTPFNIELIDMPVPNVGPEDVLIRVRATGICGSDLHTFRGVHAFRKCPVVLGHEMAGDVVEVGPSVKGFKTGDRVTMEPQIPCGHCDYCRRGLYQLCLNKATIGLEGWQGTLAEYFVCRQDSVHHLPDSVSYVQGAVVEPLAVGMHGVRRAGVNMGSSVAVLGAGTIGLTAMIEARAAGATTIFATDVASFNLDVATKVGATHTINTKTQDLDAEIRKVCPNGVDAAIITAGFPVVFEQALQILAKGGTCTNIAMWEHSATIKDMNHFLTFEQTINASWLYNRGDFRAVIDLLAQGRIDIEPMITHNM